MIANLFFTPDFSNVQLAFILMSNLTDKEFRSVLKEVIDISNNNEELKNYNQFVSNVSISPSTKYYQITLSKKYVVYIIEDGNIPHYALLPVSPVPLNELTLQKLIPFVNETFDWENFDWDGF